jgi:P-type Mg2+ transporter
VLFVIRTAGNPLSSRPSLPLAVTTVSIVLAGILLPFLPFASALGFMPLPGAFFPFLFVVTSTYLLLVEVVKRRLIGRLFHRDLAVGHGEERASHDKITARAS